MTGAAQDRGGSGEGLQARRLRVLAPFRAAVGVLAWAVRSPEGSRGGRSVVSVSEQGRRLREHGRRRRDEGGEKESVFERFDVRPEGVPVKPAAGTSVHGA
jgi:hypothetical protein